MSADMEQSLRHQLEESRRKLDLMKTMAFELSQVSSLRRKLQNILTVLHQQFSIHYSMMLLPDGTGEKLIVHSSYGYPEDKRGMECAVGVGILGLAAQKRIPINITGLERKRKYVFATTALSPGSFPGLPDPESQIAIPLIANDTLVAVLLAESYNVCVFNQEDENFLIAISKFIATSIQNSLLFDTMEELIAKRTEELQRSNETKNRLFSVISHDLRSPITAFHHLARLISHYNKTNDKEKIESLSVRVDQSVEKLNTLLDNLLNWALTQTKEIECRPQQLSLDTVLNEAIETFSDYALQKEIILVTAYAPDISVHADPDMLSAVFRNLLSNAIKFTPRHGEIRIRTSREEKKVIIEIHDTGVGIPADKLPGIFEPSEKKSTAGTENERGTGLGLLLTREFIALHHGQVSMESEEGKGTRVTIVLPSA